ncbi:MAG: hypothetical protein VX304_02775 [Planctomycetota bacterium]|nr:hypothetical protein [Planctomycetota bacterium]
MSDESGQRPGDPMSARGRLDLMLSVVRGSLDPRRWLIGGLAALVVAAGGQLLDGLSESEPQAEWPWQVELASLEGDRKAESLLLSADSQPGDTAVRVAWNPRLIGRPLSDVVVPAVAVVGRRDSWSETAVEWSRFLVAIITWSLAGVMLVRLTAADVTRGESLSLAQVTRFGLGHVASLLSAALISLSCFGVLWGLGTMGGLIAKIPTAGPLVVSLLWFIPMVLGLLMAFVAVGFVAGWPLMVATIGVEDSDGFDGFSHATGFLTDRPALLGGYTVLGTIVGSIAICLAWCLLSLTLWLASASVSTGLNAFAGGDGELLAISSGESTSLVGGREVPAGLVSDSESPVENDDVPFSSTFLVFWTRVAYLLFVGYAASVFWGIVTGLYLIVRESADGIPVTQMWLPADDVEHEAAAVEDESEVAAAEPS